MNNRFQLIILVIFILFAASGVLFLALFKNNTDVGDVPILIWGNEREEIMSRFIFDFRSNTDNAFNVSYEEVKSNDFYESVIERIASGESPDILIIKAEDLLRFEDKILPIPYELISERDFKDTFIEGGEVFLSKDGILGLPLSVDPLVMYWNRDIFQSNGFSSPPKYWSEFYPLSEKITVKDNALNITRSAVALGEYQNINNAKEIILSLLFQNNNPVIQRVEQNNSIKSVLNDSLGLSTIPAESVMRFYTEFSNPTKTSYSWNRSLPNSIDAFTSGDLAVYFGFASEHPLIKLKNPNLNFDVALFPQSSDEGFRAVFGETKAFVVLKKSANPNVAIAAASAMIGSEHINALSVSTNLPPVRRDLLKNLTGSATNDLFYRSALISRAFLDPNPTRTESIFGDLVNRIVSGRERINQAVSRANTELSALIFGN